MKTISVSSSDNLIKFPERFGGQYDAHETPHEIAHPASRHYPHEDDFIAQMLETEPMYEDEPPREEEKIKDYIHCRQQELQKFLERDDSLIAASALLLSKTKRLNEYAKRIKFYLDDLDDHQDFEEI